MCRRDLRRRRRWHSVHHLTERTILVEPPVVRIAPLSLPSLPPPSLFLLHNSCCGRELVAAAMSSQQLTPPTEPRLGSVVTEKLPVFHHPHRLPSMTPVSAIPPVASGWQCSHAFPPPPRSRHIVLDDSVCVCVCVCVCLTAGRNTNCLESATLSPSLSTTVWHRLTPVDTREREREVEKAGGEGEGLRKKRKQKKKDGRENLMQREGGGGGNI